MDQRSLIERAAALARPFAPSEVRMIVAVSSAGTVLPPCGRCRELLWQLSPRNASTRVVLGPDEGRSLAELLPQR